MTGDDLDALTAAWPPAAPTGDAAELAGLLYRDWYLCPTSPRPRTGPLTAVEVDPVPALSAADAAGAELEPGWTVLLASSTGRILAERDEEQRLLAPGEYVVEAGPGRIAEPGERVAVTARRSRVEDGFWVTRSAGWPLSGDKGLTRVYVNVCLAGAPTAVALLTGALRAAGTPYAVKVFLGLHAVQRADALVAYIPRSCAHEVLSAIAGPLADLGEAGLLEPATPRLTARLAPGVGIADGTADGASFGGTICELAARALVGAATDAPPGPTVASALAAVGRPAGRRHLEPGNDRDYPPFG